MVASEALLNSIHQLKKSLKSLDLLTKSEGNFIRVEIYEIISCVSSFVKTDGELEISVSRYGELTELWFEDFEFFDSANRLLIRPKCNDIKFDEEETIERFYCEIEHDNKVIEVTMLNDGRVFLHEKDGEAFIIRETEELIKGNMVKKKIVETINDINGEPTAVPTCKEKSTEILIYGELAENFPIYIIRRATKNLELAGYLETKKPLQK